MTHKDNRCDTLRNEISENLKNDLNSGLNNQYEIELRLGIKYPDKFVSNITKEFYDIFKNKLDKSASKGIFVKTIDHIEDNYVNNFRVTDGSVIKKDRVFIKDFPMKDFPMDIRFCISKEIPMDNTANITTTIPTSRSTYIRIKDRITYQYKNWKYDLTEVQTVKNNLKEVTYEFEIEFIKNDLDLLESAFQKIDEILEMINER